MTGESERVPAPRRNRFDRLRAASDRVPTRWFAGIGTGLFLVATAAFGGLATAAEPPIAVIGPGEKHVSDQLSITVERAVLLDEFPEAGVYVEDGERVLAVQIAVENRWSEPQMAGPLSSVVETLSIDEVGGVSPDAVARLDDATTTPWLQPGVPVDLVITWAVAADQLADGDLLHLTVNDLSLYTASFVASGQSWDDPVPAATLTLPIVDRGAGG